MFDGTQCSLSVAQRASLRHFLRIFQDPNSSELRNPVPNSASNGFNYVPKISHLEGDFSPTNVGLGKC